MYFLSAVLPFEWIDSKKSEKSCVGVSNFATNFMALSSTKKSLFWSFLKLFCFSTSQKLMKTIHFWRSFVLDLENCAGLPVVLWLSLHCSDRLFKHCSKICLVFCGTFHERVSANFIFELLSIDCRHELFRALNSQIELGTWEIGNWEFINIYMQNLQSELSTTATKW